MAGEAAEPGWLLLAGAWGDEREPPARAGWEPGWHQPPHVRDQATARKRLAEQVAAGADAIIAPTYRTSRQALARFGEARRAQEWTVLAVTLARQAVELGAERRQDGRPTLVCGSLSPPDGLGDGAADEEAYHAHAETIAEARVDVLLVELMGEVGAARTATLAAAGTGLPVWTGVRLSADESRLSSGESLVAWIEAVAPADLAGLLLYASSAEAARAGLSELGRRTPGASGLSLDSPPSDVDLDALLDLGPRLIGLTAGSTADALRPLREAIDARIRELRAAAAEATEARQGWLNRAAQWAPAGPALWLGIEPDLDLPAGFQWLVAPAGDVARLPADHYRLVVVDPRFAAEVAPARLAHAIEAGGILLSPISLAEAVADGTRVLDRAESADLAILRRE